VEKSRHFLNGFWGGNSKKGMGEGLFYSRKDNRSSWHLGVEGIAIGRGQKEGEGGGEWQVNLRCLGDGPVNQSKAGCEKGGKEKKGR